ncbi:hypothetical protein [Psychrobacter sp. I-STPA10]|uniref:hypothetical protein n=1 Tax=Psychrobacter sp. I-STPA10 TaxID=2585769 RepID=UPI001E4A0B4E|nr:hypothetical protein [Psychrobacter sp. I-STPA10]
MYQKRRSAFYRDFAQRVQQYGGMYNAHLHLDRVNTLDEAYMTINNRPILDNSFVSLHKKHALISNIHSGLAYQEQDLRRRVTECLDEMVACGTANADSMVDVTADGVGLSALNILSDIKKQYQDQLQVNLAAYSPFGFNDAHPEAWEVFCEGVKHADFIGSLPEADDTDDYPDHIGFMTHCERMLDLAQREQKYIHVHTDQRNDPSETGTERLITAVKNFGSLGLDKNNRPMVWAVHAISPSTYEDKRFEAMVEGLVENDIGIICCPSAAIGMRQLRPIQTPTYNSIPRLLEMLTAGVQVRLASDNIADICSPTTTADLTDEVFVLSAALRFYHTDILAKLATDTPLTQSDKNFIAEHLEQNNKEIQKIIEQHYR